MDSPAPPPDQVRTTQVNGGEIPVSQHLQHLKQSPSKGIKKTKQNASLKQRKGRICEITLLHDDGHKVR